MKKINKVKGNEFANNLNKFIFMTKAGLKSNDKRMQIESFLIGNINPYLNFYLFNKKKLAERFDCTIMTVSRALNLLKRNKYVNITNSKISLNIKRRSDKCD